MTLRSPLRRLAHVIVSGLGVGLALMELAGCAPLIPLLDGDGLPGPLGGCAPVYEDGKLPESGDPAFLRVELATQGDRVWFLFAPDEPLDCAIDRTTPKDVPIRSWREEASWTERPVYLTWTDDHGTTFATPQRIATSPQNEFSLALAADGSGGLWVAVASRGSVSQSPSQARLPWFVLHSPDGGETWAEVIEIDCCPLRRHFPAGA